MTDRIGSWDYSGNVPHQFPRNDKLFTANEILDSLGIGWRFDRDFVPLNVVFTAGETVPEIEVVARIATQAMYI